MKWEVQRSIVGLPRIQPGHGHPTDIKGLQLQMLLQIDTNLFRSFLLLFSFTWARTVQCWDLDRTIGHQLEIWLPVHKLMEIFLYFDYIQLDTREQVGVVTTVSITLCFSYNHFVVGQNKKILYAKKKGEKNLKVCLKCSKFRIIEYMKIHICNNLRVGYMTEGEMNAKLIHWLQPRQHLRWI